MSQRFANDQTFACDGKDKLTVGVARRIAARQNSSAYHCHSWHVGHRASKSRLHTRRPRFYENDQELP